MSLVEVAERADAPPTTLDDDDPASQDVLAAEAGQASYGQRQAAALLAALDTAVSAVPEDRSGQDRHLVVLHTSLDQLLDGEPALADPDPDDVSAEAATDTDRRDDEKAPAPAEQPETGRRRRRPVVVTGRRRSMTLPPSVLRLLT